MKEYHAAAGHKPYWGSQHVRHRFMDRAASR
jgi:hypothetical protein